MASASIGQVHRRTAALGRGGRRQGAPRRHREEGGRRHGHPGRPGPDGRDDSRVPQLPPGGDRGRVSADDAARTGFRPRGAQHPAVRPRLPRRSDGPHSPHLSRPLHPPRADDGTARRDQAVGAGAAGRGGHRPRRGRPPRGGHLSEDDLRPRLLPCRSASRQPDGDGRLPDRAARFRHGRPDRRAAARETSARCSWP